MQNPASITDVTEGFERPLTPDETRAATRWLAEAWTILRAEVPSVVGRLALVDTAPGHLATDDVVTVLATMVRRVLRNPGGRRSWGEDTYQEQIDAALSSGELYVSPAEKARLSRPAVSSGIYSLQLGV